MSTAAKTMTKEKTAYTAADLSRLYLDHSDEVQLFLLALRLGLGSHEIEDAVQEVFLRFMQKAWSDYEPTKGQQLAYLLGIARHIAIDLCRRRTRDRKRITSTKLEESTLERVTRNEQQHILTEALTNLDPEHRTIIALRHMNKLNMLQLARVLDCSQPTARKRLRLALDRLGIELRQRGLFAEGSRRDLS